MKILFVASSPTSSTLVLFVIARVEDFAGLRHGNCGGLEFSG
jgi:hypothetical protein